MRVGFAALVEFDCVGLTLAEVRRGAAEQATRAYLAMLHDDHGGNVSAIARAAHSSRHQVREHLRRHEIGRYAKKGG